MKVGALTGSESSLPEVSGLVVTGICVSLPRVVWSEGTLLEVGLGTIWPKIV